MSLCHACATKIGYLTSMQTGSLLASSYQLGKYMKHTVPDPTFNVQSIFASPSTSAYQNYIVSSSLSGSVEIDAMGRTNIVWGAGKTIGFRYEHGQLIRPVDTVKVVLSTDSGKVHAFAISSSEVVPGTCSNCGDRLIE